MPLRQPADTAHSGGPEPVDGLSCVQFASARYCVPVRLIDEAVGLRTDDERLLTIMTAAGQVGAKHVPVAPGEASVRDEHAAGPELAELNAPGAAHGEQLFLAAPDRAMPSRPAIGPSGQTRDGAFPQVRWAAAAGSGSVLGAALGPYTCGSRS
jgi:hypothetical protein